MDKKNNEDKWSDMMFAEDGIFMDIVSATEVTGMVSTPPLTDDEAEGYQGLFNMPQQIGASAQKADSPKEQKKNSGGH